MYWECLLVFLFEFNLFEIFCTSWIYMSISLPSLGKFLATFGLCLFCIFLFLFPVWNCHNINIVCFFFFFPTVFCDSCRLYLLFAVLLFVCLFVFYFSYWLISNVIPSRSLALSLCMVESTSENLYWILQFSFLNLFFNSRTFNVCVYVCVWLQFPFWTSECTQATFS